MTALSASFVGNGGAIPDQPLARPKLLLYVEAAILSDSWGSIPDPAGTMDGGADLFADTSGSIWENAAYGLKVTLFANAVANMSFGDDVIAVVDDPSTACVALGGAIEESIEAVLDIPKLLAITEAQVAGLGAVLREAGLDPDHPDDPDDTNFVLIFNAGL
ncbi:hypothetical protein HOU02_gp128 [Caulobacter phage CcrBL9]|uniref:Uncharacterized protein n=1 Tax=Caulobacter phage CcrBL9 TaxID=2283270 RepID=A0A385EE76_9CAUD|nr:hypothetical protein HOU02_gp128 [Caulobacter phage CcrBL9]AXQ69152.1 hypothetical protein CcrBL9_gp128 [Caulobacter phage CcrBL9]